jgi:DeoR/GlpR family transcriptional regulator of sugar metabolism
MQAYNFEPKRTIGKRVFSHSTHCKITINAGTTCLELMRQYENNNLPMSAYTMSSSAPVLAIMLPLK